MRNYRIAIYIILTLMVVIPLCLFLVKQKQEEIVQNTEYILFEKNASWGPCPPNTVCQQSTKLLNSGKLILTGKENLEKQVTPNLVSDVIRTIEETDVLNKDCHTELTLDYSASYKLHLGDREKIIVFPGCKDDMVRIEILIVPSWKRSPLLQGPQQLASEITEADEHILALNSEDRLNKLRALGWFADHRNKLPDPVIARLISILETENDYGVRSRVAWILEKQLSFGDATSTVQSVLTTYDTHVKAIIEAKAQKAIHALHTLDMLSLSQLVHPKRGLGFSLYLSQGLGNTYSRETIQTLLEKDEVRLWTRFEGIDMKSTAHEFLQNPIYDMDYEKDARISYNRSEYHTANGVDLVPENFPNAINVTFHIPPTGGGKWGTLKFIFDEYENEWYLIAIVKDQWTP